MPCVESRVLTLNLSCSANCAIVVIEICFGVAFSVTLWTDRWRLAGILEWVLAFLGTFYILTFVGFVAVPQEGAIHDPEREPLLPDCQSRED